MRIALVGLAASEVLIVKNYFIKYAGKKDITWTNVRDRDFDTLVIRARFLETPEIELLVQNAGPDVAVLAIYRNDQLGHEAINQGIPSLKIPSYDKSDIIEWVAAAGKPSVQSVNEDTVSENTVSENTVSENTVSENTVSENTVSESKGREAENTEQLVEADGSKIDEKQLAIEKGLAKLSATGARLGNKAVKETAPIRQAEGKSIGFPNQQILKAIKDNADLLCQVGVLNTWIKTDRRRVFCDYKLEDIPNFDALQWEKTTLTSLPKGATHQVELNQWLWEAMWKSNIDFENMVDTHSLYQLKRWPQPKSKEHRTQPLRIAAQIQKRAMTVGEIVNATQIDEATVRKFVYSMQVVGFIKKVKPEQGQSEQVQPARNASEKTPESAAKQASKVTLIKKLRNRLGL